MDVAFELTPLVAAKLIVYSLGSLIHLFLMVLILGQRRLHRLEWLLFILMVTLFMWYSGNLLALNVGLFYGVGPPVLSAISRLIPFMGLVLSAPLMVHVHAQYAARFRLSGLARRILVVAFYVPLVATPLMLKPLLGRTGLEPVLALGSFARPAVLWLLAALATCAVLNIRLRRRMDDVRLVGFHSRLAGFQLLLVAGLIWLYLLRPLPIGGLGGYAAAALLLVGVGPSTMLGYSIFRYNLLDLRVQRNLVYSLVSIFALLLYLNLVRRLGGYLEARSILPSAVTEGVMIFILVVLLEPVKKQIDRLLHAAFVSELGPVQRFAGEIQDFAKQSGDVEALKSFVEEKAPRELGLKRVSLRLASGAEFQADLAPRTRVRSFAIRRGAETMGFLDVTPVTPDLSGDQFGALELLADQLAAALELCRLIADKVQLERALADKAKMAFLGELATRIAHNVKNPLSSMKTLVQLLEEDATLPERVRQDCRMVVIEIDRLNHNISQVLRYAKPARDADRAVDLVAVVNSALGLARAEADRRGVRIVFLPPAPCPVRGGGEAAADIVSNLVVNALEASPPGGTVRVLIEPDSDGEGNVRLCVEDEGPGVPPELKERIFQPFFTTRPGGTGLGLAIVTRRAEEIGGRVELVSPLPEGRPGARFVVNFLRAG